ncbi:50S ribosome-binding GTPase [Asanoa hainanensis]|uniref:50S ribosome-binding GTPase n=2 Tax=Asanoa hainanensis TaxID=560556 RepID=A0A239PD95_9ACTN|nr:50S ribosome-binding GTPase [Asanoa hainanensis]
MTQFMGRVREALRGNRRVDPDILIGRLDAVQSFLDAADGHLPSDRLVPAHTLVERAGGRLALSRDHTLVALAGATGSGKSSLFNALAHMHLSPVGVRRPTTGQAFGCVWGAADEAGGLLDWVGVLPRNRFARESPLDGDDEAPLRGLVLLDLPDFDSVEAAHRVEVDRLLGLVDLIVWVVDPQKYGDRVVHEAYLREFHRHKDVTVVVLNQADRLSTTDLPKVLGDLRRLLEEDGLGGVPVVATAAVQDAAMVELRRLLERTVAERQAALRRLNSDVDTALARLDDLVGGPAPADVDRATSRRLADALAGVAGVPAVADATERAYRHRAGAATGWPLVKFWRKLRPDPLRRLHLHTPTVVGTELAPADGTVPATTSLPDPSAAQRASLGIALRTVTDTTSGELPEAWRVAVGDAARSRLGDLPDALDKAVAGTELGVERKRAWWRAVGLLQWLLTLVAVAGLGWLVAGYIVRALGLPRFDYPMVGEVPLPTLGLLGGLAAGILLALLVKPFIRWGARRARRRAEARMRESVAEVGREQVIAPVRAVLRDYTTARDAYAAAGPPR